eukprot:8449698-Pyramimonas_sp.AAC.1
MAKKTRWASTVYIHLCPCDAKGFGDMHVTKLCDITAAIVTDGANMPPLGIHIKQCVGGGLGAPASTGLSQEGQSQYSRRKKRQG